MPLDPRVGSKSDQENPFTALRHAIISRVENAHDDIVLKAPMGPARFVIFQSSEMLGPPLSSARHKFGMAQLQADVFEIVREGSAGQPLDVFEDKGARPQLANRPYGFREKVALVEMGAVTAS
jgi:hypothetical protein